MSIFSVGDVILDNQEKQTREFKTGEKDWRVISRNPKTDTCFLALAKEQTLTFEKADRLQKTSWNANEFHPSAKLKLKIENDEKYFRKITGIPKESRLFVHGFQPPATKQILEKSLLLFLKNFNLHRTIKLNFKPNLFPNGKQRIFGFLYIYGLQHKEAATAIAEERTFELYDNILTVEYPRCKKQLSD
jgi:hypothetical protein